ncbi:scoloptoxin SSD976-like [Chelonus insularis]|uniref:scoloptoxin SSD976-like n=1 Tax=Chelonus insularis TaxID=460826 RepID=UPI00158BEC6F|nr:scoloptoxin SSD976-like [Chelonus insularis]
MDSLVKFMFAIIFLSTFVIISSSCIGKTILRIGGLSCQDKQTILDEHNRLRQLVALGQVQGQPHAANMREMIWDDELATTAQRWAETCAEFHDSSRHVRRFIVGQNIARTWTSRPLGPYDSAPNWRRQISGWFSEVQFYHGGYHPTTGHYTQVVWANTFLIGCGYTYFYDPARGYTKNYVCNYGPSGNIIGQPPYRIGQPSCNRFGLAYSNRYAGLCSRDNIYYLGAFCTYLF